MKYQPQRLYFPLLICLMALGLVIPLASSAQQFPVGTFSNLFTDPLHYSIHYTESAPIIDGDINDKVWQRAPWSQNFQDIEGSLKSTPAFKTNFKMLWNDSCLFIAAKLEDTAMWSYLHQHDDIVFHDNDFEIFIDPSNTTHQYFEIEINPLNTIFDLFLNKPYRNQGDPLINWDVSGLHSAVKIQGTLNDPSDKDKGWTLEMAIPFSSIGTGFNKTPPKPGSFWRLNFSRVEWDTKAADGKYVKIKNAAGGNLPEHNWVWSPQGVINMHFPERWGYVQFNKDSAQQDGFILPYSEQQRKLLWLLYYKEKDWLAATGGYFSSLKKAGLKKRMDIGKNMNELNLQATQNQFIGSITDAEAKSSWSINQDGLVRQIKKKIDE